MLTGLTKQHMPTQFSASATLNRRHDFKLTETDMAVM
jgi:hypothetical protein